MLVVAKQVESGESVDQSEEGVEFPVRFPVDVVFITTDLKSGGTTKNLLNLVRGLPKMEFHPHVISLRSGGRGENELERAGVSWQSIEVSTPPHPESLFRLVEALESIQPTIVHTFLFHANILGRFAASFAGVPVVISSVRVCEVDRSHHLWLDRLTQSFVDCEVCVSPSVRDFTEREAGISADKLTTIPNGVDVHHLSSGDVNEEALRKQASVPSGNRPLVLSAGRLTRQKGFDLLLNALPSLREQYPELVCVIFGEGEARDELEQQVQALSLEDTVFLPGWTDLLPEWIRISDLFVLPSRWEGFPNVLLEAAVLQVPIVATRTRGADDLFDSVEADGGIMVEPGSEQLIANAMKEVLNRHEEFQQRAEEFGNQVSGQYSISRMVSEHRSLYRRLIRDLIRA